MSDQTPQELTIEQQQQYEALKATRNEYMREYRKRNRDGLRANEQAYRDRKRQTDRSTRRLVRHYF